MPHRQRIIRYIIQIDLVTVMGWLLSLTIFSTGCMTLQPAAASTDEETTLSPPPISKPLISAAPAPPDVATNTEPPVEPLVSRRYTTLLIKDTGHVLTSPLRWTLKDWALFGADTALVIGTAALDRPIQKYAQHHRTSSTDTLARIFDPLGNEYALAVPGGFYLTGMMWHDNTAKATAQDSLAASLVESGVVAPTLKFAFGRSRPKAGHGAYRFEPFIGGDVFPSGHTGEAFTLASVVTEHYDSWWVKTGAYGAASLVGVARIIDNAHFASDVIAGALIGTAVGKAIVHFNKQERLRVSPLIGSTTKGLKAVYSF